MNEEYLIKKWLADELTEAEWEAFKKLEDYPFYKAIVENAGHFKASHFSVVDDFETFSARMARDEKPAKKLNRIQPLLRIAAIFIIGIGTYFTFFFNNIVEIQTPAGETATVQLPDASTVTLNALSGIRYSKNRWNREREVKLNGEAFFDVTEGVTFDVITVQGKVSVLGTRFNVKQRKDYFEVMCSEGKVRVSSLDSIITLTAGEMYRISNGSHTRGETSLEQPRWIEEKASDFKSVPFGEVIAELERQYNIPVILEDVDANQLFTGSFVHNDLESALQSVTKPLNLNYSIKMPDQVIIYGKKQ